jgi:heterodisulfide reductase subunit A
MSKKKVGVYICHCGTNIGGVVDVAKIAEEIGAEVEDVAVCRHYKYMCSEPGQQLIQDDIADLELDYVVEASCSPKMHEPTFRNAVSQAGMNQYMFEMVNIREHCSWITEKPEMATQKAKALIKGGIARVKYHRPLVGSKKPVNPKALVVGGGIAGITTALKIANSGYQVYMVEKEEIIGGRMAQFDKTFPTLDCAGCTLTPKTSEVGRHPNIEILTKAEVAEVSGFVGNFKVKVRQQPRYVNLDKCTGCGDCQPVCPINVESKFELGMATRHPISRPFPQAIPNKYSIIREGMPPCQEACPAGVNVVGYMNLAGLGKFDAALALVRERMPFAASCGRICFHPCETACKRGQMDKPLAICQTKRYLGDQELSQGAFAHPEKQEERPERIALVGGGPASMSAAYYLALMGFKPVIFEAAPEAGGWLRYGIPEYRLPKAVLKQEVDNLASLGVEINYSTPIGPGRTIDDLLTKEGFAAVFLGVGAQDAMRLPVPGAESDGVYWGVEYLRDSAMGQGPELAAKRVLIIGGGNVAVDAARTAVRQGAAEIIMISLESREEMPASAWEVEEAEHEGVQFEHRWGVKQILAQNGKVTGIELRGVERVLDEEGRFAPTYLDDQLTTRYADAIIMAIGQKTNMKFITPEDGVALTERGLIQVDEDTLATSRPGVFAGGDCTLGPASFVQAVAKGREAAESIYAYLVHGGLREVTPKERLVAPELTAEERLRAQPIARQEMPTLTPEERQGSFAEVERGFTAEMAQAEGQRCMSCSLCCQCGECVRACGPGAVDLKERKRIRELEVGAIVVATGIDIFEANKFPEYGHGKYPDVLTNLQFERLCNAAGPTGGKVVRPSDGKVPESIVFIQCVGSRDKARGGEYCSKVCCMISAKQLSIFKHHNREGKAYVFYIDNRAGGKGYEEFLRRAMEEEGATYIRGRVAKVFQEGGRLVVRGENSLVGGPVEVEADMVVLATGLTPQKDYLDVARALNLAADKHGFFLELHPKLGPVETSLSGIFLAGGCQGPKDIPESVAQGGAAAAEALTLFSLGEVEVEPTVASVDERLCTGCKTCVSLCAYNAVSFSEAEKVAVVNEALCQGCGTCAAACPAAALRVQHFTPDQIFAQIEGMLAS